MRSIDVRYLRLLWETPLIARLLEFNDSSGGVAAFLDHLETREIDVPLLKSVPNLAEYGRDLTRYLLFLHEIASSYILVPYIHDEKEVVKVEIEVKIDPRGVENDPECPIARVRIVRVSGAGTDTIAVHVSDLPHEYLIGNTARRIAELLHRPPLIVIDDLTQVSPVEDVRRSAYADAATLDKSRDQSDGAPHRKIDQTGDDRPHVTAEELAR